jgi:hypothetical protein
MRNCAPIHSSWREKRLAYSNLCIGVAKRSAGESFRPSARRFDTLISDLCCSKEVLCARRAGDIGETH